MNAPAVVFAIFAVLILASVVAENRVWKWYVRLCGGRPTRENERAAHTARSATRR